MAKWRALRGAVASPKREQFRLFCIWRVRARGADRRGLPGQRSAVITGMRKPWMTTFGPRDYAGVRGVSDDYLGTMPAQNARTFRFRFLASNYCAVVDYGRPVATFVAPPHGNTQSAHRLGSYENIPC